MKATPLQHKAQSLWLDHGGCASISRPIMQSFSFEGGVARPIGAAWACRCALLRAFVVRWIGPSVFRRRLEHCLLNPGHYARWATTAK
jgi:hypothetical protein